MVVAMMVVAMPHRRRPVVRYDAAVILTRLSAGRIVVGQGRRSDGCEESRADGGDQETLHSLFLWLDVTTTLGQCPRPRLVKVTARDRECNKTLGSGGR